MCETANIEIYCCMKVYILFTPTREYMRNSKYLTYGCKMHIWFSPTRGYMLNNKHLKYCCTKSVHIIYPDTGIYAK